VILVRRLLILKEGEMLKKLADRFKEPSSWSGITAILAAVGVSAPEGMIQAATGIAAGLAFLVSFFMKEKGSK
jgi:hypothetical protein